VSFVHPERLWLLTVLPILVLWAIRARLKRRRAWEALAQRGRAPRDGTLWWLSAVALLMVAIAQPRWGRLGSPRPPGHDAILVVDISRSMGAEDAVPNRLAVAVEAAEGLVNALAWKPDDRAAVVAFSGRGLLLCPLTENLRAVIDTLHRLRPGGLRPGGTDLGAGLDAALDALGTDEHAQGQAIVVFSDGEDLADRWRSRLDRLRQRDVVVHAVTIGDPDQGHPVPSGAGDKPLVYRGEPVLSKRFDATLDAIARETGGAIVRMGLTSADLGMLYRTRIEPTVRRRAEIPRIADLVEQFPLFLIAALTCLLAACWPPGRGWSWHGGWLWRGSWFWRKPAKALGRVALAIALAAAVTGADPSPQDQPRPGTSRDGEPPDKRVPGSDGASPSGSPRSESAAELVARGRVAYEAERFDEALAHFEAAARLAPDAAVPHYDAAAVLFRLGRYDEAHQRYREARRLADSSLRTKIDYALGNTALALGDVPAAIHAYDECIASTARGAALDVVRRDATINRDFAYRQAQSPSVPQGQGSDDPSASHKPDRRKAPDSREGGDAPGAEDEQETGPTANGTSPGDDAEKAARRDRPPKSRRRMGDAGGGRSTPPGPAGESPEDRLDAALENLNAARSRRLPEEPPPASANDDRRDW
jgi:Ca-activated chloride channel family protein